MSDESMPTDPLDEWDLEANPVPLAPLCDICGGDATGGQSTAESILCPVCLEGIMKRR